MFYQVFFLQFGAFLPRDLNNKYASEASIAFKKRPALVLNSDRTFFVLPLRNSGLEPPRVFATFSAISNPFTVREKSSAVLPAIYPLFLQSIHLLFTTVESGH